MRRHVVLISVLATVGSLFTASVSSGSDVITQRGSDIDGEANNDNSGYSVAMSSDGNTIAIGAWGNDGNGNGVDSGHVRIYTWNGTTWTQRGTDIDGEASSDLSGYSVAMSSDGNTIAIGAPGNGGNGGFSLGHVRIYTWNGTTWTQRGTDIDGEASGDESGLSVAMSSDGNTIAIGAWGNDGNGNGVDSGHVRIYTWNGTTWTQRGHDIDGEASSDLSGYSVAMSSDGNTIAIGAPGNDGNGNASGHVRIYTWNGTTWTQYGTDIDGEASGDESGYSVAMSSNGNTIAIGALYNDGNGFSSGHVRIYTWNGTTWTQYGTDINGEAVLDQSGSAVAMSSNGNTIAIGAFRNDGNGNASGHVRIYTWNGTTWTQRGTDINGEAVLDQSGSSVAMSSNGNTIAIGAYGNDGNGVDSGHVRIYASSSPPIVPIWRATLDPNNGTCRDTTQRTQPWTTVFVAYRYLPGITDCTRNGHTFAGWASTTNPTSILALPTLIDPSDGQPRMFLATNADLIAVWNKTIDPITDLAVFANFLCGPCTNAWLLFTPSEHATSYGYTLNSTPATCSPSITVFGLHACQLTSLPAGTPLTATVTPRNADGTGPSISARFTLRP